MGNKSESPLTTRSLNWRPLGQVFRVTGEHGWTHAQVPQVRKNKEFGEILFAARRFDAGGSPMSEIRSIDLQACLALGSDCSASSLMLRHGPVGTFFEHGAMPGSVVRWEDQELLFFTGWSRSVSVPYRLAIGKVRLDAPPKWEHNPIGPILSVSETDPYTQAQPAVFSLDGGLAMIYQSGYGWLESGGAREILYRLRFARLNAAGVWVPSPQFCVPKKFSNECQTSPTVLRTSNGNYVMYFGYRDGTGFRSPGKRSYRIGCATSSNLARWVRQPDPDLGLSDDPIDEWASEMQTYPRFLMVDGKLFLLFCGNEFGKFGFGAASCVDDLGDAEVIV